MRWSLALWWGRGGGCLPTALDALDVAEHVHDPAAVAVGLLAAAGADLVGQGARALPGYTMQLPRTWRGDAVASRTVAWRRDACRRSGLNEELERLQYAWSPGAGVPAASTHLVLRAGSDEELLGLFVGAAHGSLDIETQQALEEVGEQVQVRDDLEFYLGCPGERQWWRVAVDRDGSAVGFAIPSATPHHRNVGYFACCRPGAVWGSSTTCWGDHPRPRRVRRRDDHRDHRHHERPDGCRPRPGRIPGHRGAAGAQRTVDGNSARGRGLRVA